jgi:cag pathogenicity island protein 24
MKYRLLTLEELKELEPEFIRFLSSNQITADDWVSIKANNLQKVDELVELFSDIVLEKVLSKVKYAEQRSSDNLLLFHFTESDIILTGLSTQKDSDIDFTQQECIANIAENPEKYSGQVNLFKSKKTYSKSREEEIFAILSAGGLITDEKLFNALSSI